jgi:hypothetical protein
MIQGGGSQLVLNITQEVRPLPIYISKLYGGKEEEELNM